MTRRPTTALRTERETHIRASPGRVWAALEHVERYQAWWPWLRSFDARGLIVGDSWSCTVKPPLPYRVTFGIELQEVVGAASVTALVTGDVVGPARIELVPRGADTTLRLVAELRAGNPWLQRLERWARPVARFGHDRIVDRALSEFAALFPDDD